LRTDLRRARGHAAAIVHLRTAPVRDRGPGLGRLVRDRLPARAAAHALRQRQAGSRPAPRRRPRRALPRGRDVAGRGRRPGIQRRRRAGERGLAARAARPARRRHAHARARPARRPARLRGRHDPRTRGARLEPDDLARRRARRPPPLRRRERRVGARGPPRLKLGFDATSLAPEGKGLARFQREFLTAAAALGEPEQLVVFVPAEPDPGELPAATGWSYVRVRPRPMLRWEQLGPPRVVYVFEHPSYRAELGRRAGVGKRQRVVDAVTLALFSVSQRRAAEVLAASEATRRALGRGRVVYPGVSAEFTPGGAKPEYFLHLASHDPR